MHPVPSGANHIEQSYPQRTFRHSASAKSEGLIRRWLGMSIRNWRRRKMIAALQALDSRMLRDIGIERCDIKRVVEGLDARELRMVPLATKQQDVKIGQPFGRTA